MAARYPSAIHESNAMLYTAWGRFARKFPRAEVREFSGITITWAGAQWPMLNMVGLCAPIAGIDELKAKLRVVAEFTGSQQATGMLVVCKQWLPPIGESELAAAFAERGLVRAMTLTGMVTDSVLPPRRPMPKLNYRGASDPATSRDLVDLNSVSYNAPLEFGREVSDIRGYWDGGFAYVGYEGDRPVTTAVTMPVAGCRYVGWVATHPEARRKGYAEAAMRHSLDAAAAAGGPARTILHASEIGFPVYGAMGYREVANFEVYFPEALVRAMATIEAAAKRLIS